ncbi:DUF7660 family protein [Sorangium sp. So ce1099]|uniref:DUF7660 family protein n=1 Tax=Sorangium sp. So ce1099 TaxID=3133331 RepID=UPI003F5FBD78
MTPQEMLQSIGTKEDLSKFILSLAKELENNPDYWTNRKLEDYLEAMAAWILELDAYYANLDEQQKEQPTWRTFGDILMAATMYE